MISLAGKTAVITGGSRGIGRAICFQLAEAGANVVVADIAIELARETAAAISATGAKAMALQMDVRDRKQVKAAFDKVVTDFGALDILVNNAGVLSNKPLEEISKEDWDFVMGVNMEGPFVTAQAAFPLMKRQGDGRIVNIASIAGKKGPGAFADTVYSASKAGVIGLTKGMAKEGAEFGITANGICPGPADTEMTKGFSDETKQLVAKGIPLGRLAKDTDIAKAVVFLVSDLARYITGEIMDVNGGLLMD